MLYPVKLLCGFTGGSLAPVVNTARPVFAWGCRGQGRHAFQRAFRLLVSAAAPERPVVWDSGKILEADNFVAPPADCLQPFRAYAWKVCLWDARDRPGPFSAEARFHTGSFDETRNLETAQSMVGQQRVLPEILRRTADDAWLADFGRDAYGTLELTLAADEPGAVEVQLGEVLDDQGALYRPEPRSRECNRRFRSLPLQLRTGRHTYRLELPQPALGDEYQCKGYNCRGPVSIACPAHTGEFMPFRYCAIRGYRAGLEPVDVVQLAAAYPFDDDAAHFASSDENLNRVWDFCKHTIKTSTPLAAYVDGDRERQVYGGDAWFTQLAHYCLDTEYSLARNTLEFLFETGVDWPYESIMSIPLMARADYYHTGSLDCAARYYERMKAMLFPGLVRADGLLATGEISGDHPIFGTLKTQIKLLRDLVEWPPNLRDDYEIGKVNMVTNCSLYRALLAMGEIARGLERDAEARNFEDRAQRLKAAVQAKLFDPAIGLFVDSEGSRHSALAANTHAIVSGIANPEQFPAIVAFLKRKGMACGVAGAHFLLEALCLGGAADFACDLLVAEGDRSWLNMLKQGATMTMECWTNALKPNQDWNHPWGASPLHIVARHMLGIRPLAPGFRKILIAPCLPERLQAACIEYPTIRGAVKVACESDGRAREFRIETPGNAETLVVLPGFLQGRKFASVEYNGGQGAFRLDGDRIRMEGLMPGVHHFRIAY